MKNATAAEGENLHSEAPGERKKVRKRLSVCTGAIGRRRDLFIGSGVQLREGNTISLWKGQIDASRFSTCREAVSD